MSVASFDIECDDWDIFVVGALRTADGDIQVYWDADDMFDALIAYRGEIWTWAGGRYDMLWVAETAAKRGMRCVARTAGGAPVSMKVGLATFRDGFKLFPESLKKVAPLAKLEKAPTGLVCRRDHDDNDDCGGYCRIRRNGMSREEKRALQEYLCHDVRCTSGVIDALQALAAEHGIELKSTVGASAWATLQAMGAPDAEWEQWRDYRATRRGYYGGRTEMYQTGRDVESPDDDHDPVPVVWRADLNSAYPAALVSTPVPVGPYKRLFGDQAAAAFATGKPGVYDARVHVPDCHIPPLPVRGKDRLLFVTGDFAGSWTHLELSAALDLGARVERITAAIVWERAETIAKPFCEKFWGLRDKYGKKSPEGRWLKWFCNSCTGKLAMKPEGERCVVAPRDGERKMCPADGKCFHRAKPGGPARGPMCGRIGRCCPHVCTQKCGRWHPMGRAQVVWSAPSFQLSDCSHVGWAATLTAVTRVEWLRQARECGDAMVYGDTDSVYAAKPITRRIGKALGEWNDEGIGLDWLARGPKAYRFADGETGEYVTKSKGVPRLGRLDGDAGHRRLAFDRWASGASVTLPAGVWGFKGGAMRDDLFCKRRGAVDEHGDRSDYSRSSTSNRGYAGSRVVLPTGRTRPLSWAEYHELLDAGVM